MRCAWVPLPAPGGPSRITGPIAFCAATVAIAAFVSACRWYYPEPYRGRSPMNLTAVGAGAPARASGLRPRAATADAAAARSEAFVVAHDQLRLDLLHGVHGDADDDEQRG